MKIELALQLLLAMLNQVGTLGAAIRKAREEGRDDLTDEELKPFRDADDEARARLQAEIDRQKTG